VNVFVETARSALQGSPTPTCQRAGEVLPPGGVVLDVGCGAGAASLPVAPPAGRVVAVDEDPEMLRAFSALAASRVQAELIEGRWPQVAGRVGQVDVALSANVAYNVADLGAFVEALTAAASCRVVLELSALHPQSSLTPLWEHFWGLSRPSRPTWEDAVAVVREVTGCTPAAQEWSSQRSFMGERGNGTVAWVRRRLCLGEDREGEVATLLGRSELDPSAMVTLWWPGGAPVPNRNKSVSAARPGV